MSNSGTWACQIIFSSAENGAVPQGLAFRWMEVILESGGGLRTLPNGASIASWRDAPVGTERPPAPILAAWAIRAATEQYNASLKAEGKAPLRLTMLLHGPELCDAVEGPIHARRLHGRLSLTANAVSLWLTDPAAARVGSTFALRRTTEAPSIASPSPARHEALGPRRGLSARVEVTIPPPAPREPAPLKRVPPREAVEIRTNISWIPTPGSNDRTREFTLVPAAISRAA
jgi:hypothetical protein